MNGRFLTTVFIIVCCFLFVSKSNACDLPPLAKISNPYSQTICVGGSVSFDGSTSCDQDEGGDSIDVYYWNYSDDSDWHEDGATPSHTFNTADTYWVYLYVRDDEETLSENYDSCVVYVVKVNDIEEDKTQACVGEPITFTANSFPLNKPLGCIEWQKRYKEKSTDPWGDWETADGGNTAVLNTDIPGFYRYQARNGSDDSWKLSSVVTVIRAKILLTPEYVLVYIGDHAGEQPTRLAMARGDPKGGTFDWSYEKLGNGDIEFIEFVDLPNQSSSLQTAEIKGTVQSSLWYDVKLKVTYTLDGTECEASSTLLTVRRPQKTTAYAGDIVIAEEEDNKHYRKYYHMVSCQLGAFLEDIGIPFEEDVTPEGSETGITSTQRYDADNQGLGEWPGGIAARDQLSCPAGHEDAEFHQKLYGGGWLTTPEFNIFFQPIEGWPSIWKETAP